MRQYTFPYARGIWINDATETKQGYASELINFLPTLKDLQLRKGHKILDFSRVYNYTASFLSLKLIVNFTEAGITTYNTINGIFEDVIADSELEIPINHIETNNRLIFFFENSPPREFYKNTLTNGFLYEDLTFNEGDTPIEFTNFSGAVRYRERLFYYKEGNNQLYYTSSGAYKGTLDGYNISNIFNTKGSLVFLEVAGYSAGSGVESNLVAGFNSGDILVFDGTNPSDTNSWRALTAINLGIELYNQTIVVGTQAFALSSIGIISISSSIARNSINNAKFSEDIKDGYAIDFSRMRLAYIRDYIIMYVNNEAYDYVYSIVTAGYCKIDGIAIQNSDNQQDNVYFISNNILYQGFVAPSDQVVVDGVIEPKEVIASYRTAWSSIGIQNNKLVNLVIVGLYQNGGIYNVYVKLNKDYKTTTIDYASLPRQLNKVITRDEVEIPRDEVEKILWTSESSRINDFRVLKFARATLGRTISAEITVIAQDIIQFSMGDITLNYTVTGF